MKVADDKTIVKLLLEGHTLCTVVTPCPSLPSNYPLHTLSYDLPFVIAKGDKFWAFSKSEHLHHEFGKGLGHTRAFCYTNIVKNMYGTWTPEVKGVSMMSKTRYKEFDWILKKSGNLIWDSSDKTADVNKVFEAIKTSKKLWIAMLDGEDVWQFHTVALPMFETNEKRFSLKTSYETYPTFFRSTESTVGEYEANKNYYDVKPSTKEDNSIRYFETGYIFPTFYNLFSDGTYYNYFDIQRGSKQRYKQLKVFEELSFDEGTE